MESEPIFRICLVCDIVRPEPNQKVTLLGLLGVAPNIEIIVPNPHQPILDLSFFFISKRLTELGNYRVGLSVKDPEGVILFPMAEQTFSLSKPGVVNLAFSFRPFKLTGPGSYTAHLLVNDVLDLETRFSIVQGNLSKPAN